MSITENMSIDDRCKYLYKTSTRYWKAKSKKEKAQLLDEFPALASPPAVE